MRSSPISKKVTISPVTPVRQYSLGIRPAPT